MSESVNFDRAVMAVTKGTVGVILWAIRKHGIEKTLETLQNAYENIDWSSTMSDGDIQPDENIYQSMLIALSN